MKCKKHIPIVHIKMFRVQENSVEYGEKKIVMKQDFHSLIWPLFEGAATEQFLVMGVDNNNHPTVIKIDRGDVNQCATYPKTIFKILLLSNSTDYMVAHNHPGNGINPSEADWMITERLQKAGKLFDMRMVDHLILTETPDRYSSMRELARWGN